MCRLGGVGRWRNISLLVLVALLGLDCLHSLGFGLVLGLVVGLVLGLVLGASWWKLKSRK